MHVLELKGEVDSRELSISIFIIKIRIGVCDGGGRMKILEISLNDIVYIAYRRCTTAESVKPNC